MNRIFHLVSFRRHFRIALILSGVLFASLMAPGQAATDGNHMLDSLDELPMGMGLLPGVTVPSDNPQTAAKIELGSRLFFDKRLSGNMDISCATCHDPARGLSDGRPRAVGSHGVLLPRRTPSVLNAAYNSSQFWDGRAASLEAQAVGPLSSTTEMNMLDQTELMARLNGDPYYPAAFRSIFGQGPNLANVAKAIAAFERTLVSRGSRFDRYASGDKNALTASEKNGLVLFIGKARCTRCHNGPNFTDNQFHNIGVGEHDAGRYDVTHAEADRGAFKTPGLRDVARHAPYMHDGSVSTLDEVIAYYDRGGNSVKGKSPFVMKIGLTAAEKHDLLAFLRTLDDATRPADQR